MGLMNIRRMMMNSAPQEVTVGPSAIASFSTNLAVPMKSVKVNIDPIQDLHGQESPYPAGGGKNKLYPPDVTWKKWRLGSNIFYPLADDSALVSFTVDGDTITVTTTRAYVGVGFEIGASSSDRTISAVSPFGAVQFWSAYSDGASRISTGASSCTIPANTAGFIAFRIDSVTTVTIKAQLEDGSIATAWSPYSNICPISGRTEVNVGHSGKNLVDEQTLTYKKWRLNSSKFYTVPDSDTKVTITVGTDAVHIKTTATYYGFGFEVSAVGYDRICAISGASTSKVALYSSYTDGESAVSASVSTRNTCTIPANTSGFVAVRCDAISDYDANIQIEVGSTATPYEPYSGQSINIALGQTVYGGTLDVVSGVLTIDRATVDLGTLNWTPYPKDTYQDFRSSAIDDSKVYAASEKPNAVCDSFKVEKRTGQGTNYTLGITASKYVGINTPLNSYSDAASFKAAMSGVMLVYELATPIIVQLIPHEIRSYLGGNNVWADSGDTEVTYYAKP